VAFSFWTRFGRLLRGLGVWNNSPKKQRPEWRKPAIRLPPRFAPEPSRYLAVMAVAKNEGRYLREWLEFQRLMGAEQVYLYDNGSTDNSAEIVAPFIREGFVTLIPWATFDDEVSPQRQGYAHALCNFGPDFRWMAFIDLDEFLFPVEAPDLVSVLRGYEDCPSVCVPWFMFGFSGHDKPVPGLVIESYTQRAPFPPPPRHAKLLKWKSIVQPAEVVAVVGAHLFELASGLTGGFDERKAEVTQNEATPPPGDVLRVNHYYSRSREEFTTKLNMVRFTTGPHTHRSHTDPRNRERIMNMIEAENLYDSTITRFVSALYKRMKLR
jgi:hypothetical protein